VSAPAGAGGAGRRRPRARYSPARLARLLGLPEPTPEQAAVIAAPLAPVAVVAGAGSGKSETMAARLVWLVANGLVRPERVLGLTFTRKAAAELDGRVRDRLDGLRRAGLGIPEAAGQPGERAAPPCPGGPGGPGMDGEPVIATYHSYAGRLIAEHALREALEPTLSLITPAVAWQLAARVVASYDGPMDATDWSPVTVTRAVLDLAGELAEHLRDPADVLAAGERLRRMHSLVPRGRRRLADEVLRLQRVREQLVPLVRAYARVKAEQEVIDHGDQLAVAARIALAHPEVGAAERERYQVVLLDEFQDTSHAQLELLRALFGGGHPVTAVGDPCQSIYGWRGASAGNMKRFARCFPPAGDGNGSGARGARRVRRPAMAPVHALSTSFRNTGAILEAAAAIQRDLRVIAPEVPRLIAPPERAGRGEVVCALLQTIQDEAEWVAARVAELLALPRGVAPDGRPWPDGRLDRVRPSDIAVLCRKRTQFPALRAALEARGIPVEVVGLGGLLTVPEVADIVATLRVLHTPAASDSLARILTSPRWRIGPQDLVALGGRARELAAGGAGAGEGGQGRRPVPQGDHLEAAVADFTAEAGSLVEALDDLGDPGRYTQDGYERLAALATELRSLRRHVGRPLPDLVATVERALGLDIEVAARPGRGPVAARADLDAFADAAAEFAGDAQEPTLGAFLAYLSAAESEEFGLEAGQVTDADAVKLATVHSAKGLQWPAVVVPGLSAGPVARNFPARPRLSTRWTSNPRLLPFWLRGDASDLPELAGLDPESVAEFSRRCAERDLAEERRLAYVAVTRAAYWLACSGYWWGTGKRPLGPSPFLAEVRAACEEGAGRVAAWADGPADGEESPVLAQPLTASWPPAGDGGEADPPGARARYEAVREAADQVRAAAARLGVAVPRGAGAAAQGDLAQGDLAEGDLAEGDLAEGDPAEGDPAGEAPGDIPPEYAGLVAGWAADADLLLAEQAARRGPGDARPAVRVDLPRRIGVGDLVVMARDAGELAARLRRPMPRPPAPRAERGTAFHRWLEERFGPTRLIDPDELAQDAGAADSGLLGSDADLDRLKASFERGAFGQRWPEQVEVAFETRVGDRLVRGRIDAVFHDAADGCYDVVDWKTGRPPPPGSEEERAAAVQLAVYRLAWAGLANVPVERVRAAFYYVRQDRIERPADLLGADGLAALVEAIPAPSRAARAD